jgi:very-short-patch-repair endonuclease
MLSVRMRQSRVAASQILGLSRVIAGRPGLTTVFCQNPGGAARDLCGHLGTLSSPPTVVGCPWGNDAFPRSGLDGMLQSLAEALLALWPEWYSSANARLQPSPRVFDDPLPRVVRAGSLVPGVAPGWLRSAAARASAARLPLCPHTEPALQVEQMVRAVDRSAVIVVTAYEGSGHGLECFVSTIRWLAAQPLLRVLALVPEVFRNAPEVTPIAYHSLCFEQVDVGQEERFGVVTVWPTAAGRAASAGELVLQYRIRSDAELRPLFTFNVRVETKQGHGYECDAVWREGRVCVEVDGHHWHAQPEQFRKDRQRDFEMLVSDHLVLRLPHDEVLNDPEQALEKVREVVHHRLTKTKETGIR